MASPTLNFAYDVTKAIVSSRAASSGLAYTSNGKLTLVSGLAVSDGLGFGQFGNDSYVNGPIRAANGGLIPQTLTTAVYQNLHLVAGQTLKIQTQFIPGESHYRDESVVLLKDDVTGSIRAAKIADVQTVIDNNGATHYTTTFTIPSTSTYNVLVGVADIGDGKHPSTLKVETLSVDVPAGQYSIEPGGVRLADNALLRSDNSILIGNVSQPSLLSNSSAGLIAGLDSLLKAGVISNDGSTLISQDGGGALPRLISQDGGGVVSNDGGSLISQDGGGLISQDGGGLLGSISGAQLAQIAAGLAQANGLQARAFAAASSSGLTGHNYGIMSLDGPADPVPTSGGTAVSAPVPGLEVNASSGAVANRYDDASAVADLGGGKYVVAFSEYSRDATTGVRTYAIRAQIFNADGTTSGDELTASQPLPGTTIYGTSANVLTSPSVASLGNGAFVIAWENASTIRPGATGGFSTGADLFAQRFNADGSKLGAQISLDAGTTDAQYADVKVTALIGGGFVAVWGQTASPTNSLSSVHGKLFDADGAQRGTEFVISGSAALADLRQPAVTATSNGGFVVSFQGKTTDPSTGSVITGIGAQGYTAAGTAVARNPAIVAISDTQKLQQSSLATLPNGNVAIAWFDAVAPGASPALYSLVLSPSLVPLQTTPTLVSGTATIYYGNPSVTALSDGRFVVGYTASGSVLTTEAQIMAADNTTVGAPFAIYAPGGGDADTNPALVQLGTGTLIAASTHKFYYLPASDVRALPLALSSSTSNTQAGAALKVGAAVHGYVSGGTVFADANGNGALDAGEISATTTADGLFALAPGAVGTLVLTGGTDVATGRPFTGRYTAPSGSQTVDALTTLVQRVMAGGVDIGTAQMKVATALGLSADAALTQVDPMLASQASDSGRAILLANAILADVSDLAIAAGSVDPLGVFASAIAAQAGFASFDPSSLTALAAAGLTGQTLTDTSAIAAAVKTLLSAKAAADAGDPAKLVADVNRTEVVVQTGAAPALAGAIATGTTAAVASAYTGAGLEAKFNGTATGSAGPVPPSITPATVGVFRFFDSNYGTHFFTASTAERDTILASRADLINEGVGLQSVDPTSKDPNATPIFRFFDTKFGTHFFTASTDERDQVIAGRPDLAFEGTGFYEHTTQQAGDVAVYRFFDSNFGTHFYTSDPGERAGIVATRADLIDEGIGFYAPKTPM